MLRFLGQQFKKPKGVVGRVASFMMKQRNLIKYDELLSQMVLSKEESILEIGYGHGLGLQKMVTDYNCQLVGGDFSKLMYTEASKRNQPHISSGRIKLHCADYLEMPFDE